MLSSPTPSAVRVGRLCLRSVRLLARACAAYGTAAVRLLCLDVVAANPAYGYARGGSGAAAAAAAGQLVARLVAVVHEEVAALLLLGPSGPGMAVAARAHQAPGTEARIGEFSG